MDIPFPQYSDFDAEIWQRELEDFVPGQIVDAHTHIWDERFAIGDKTPESGLRINVSLENLDLWSRTIFPGRQLGYVLLPAPIPEIDIMGQNDWVTRQAAGRIPGQGLTNQGSSQFPLLEAGMLVHPGHSPEYIADHALNRGVKVLKPYRVYTDNPAEARIRDFFPENQIAAADDLGLAVVLHLSRREGPADPVNIADLKRYSRDFPHVTWILAHCARGFNPVHLESSVAEYAAMKSIWVDTSAITEPYSHFLMFRHFDKQKIIFGSDNVAAGSYRGKYIAFGKGWKAFQQEEELEHCDNRCTLVIYEQLRAMKQAADMAGLGRREITNIFCNNIMDLL